MSKYMIALMLFLHLVLLTGLCDEGSLTLRAWTLLAVADVIAIGVLINKTEKGDDENDC